MPMSPDEMLSHLDAKLLRSQKELRRLDEYFQGLQPLRFLAPEIRAEFGDRLSEVVINWPELVGEAYENRLDLTGFQMPGSTSDGVDVDEADADLWGIWKDNDMVRQSQQAHLESVALGRSYAILGARGKLDEGPVDPDALVDPFETATDSPLITVEHPMQCITEDDPRTRNPVAGLKRWKDADHVNRATLYMPGATRHYLWARKWVLQDVDEHRLGVVPVVPLINRQRLLHKNGRSEFESIIPIADAANKMATDMMVSGEFHAMPRRWVLGMDPKDFKDQDGNPISPFEQIAGRIWGSRSKPGDAQLGQFTESDLAVFHSTLRVLAQICAQLAALPPHYMGFTTDNPASADAIRSSEASLVKRVERKQTGFGSDWQRVMSIALLIRDGSNFDKRILRAETVWRDASTPTVAQVSDAASKRKESGIATLRQARIDCGYSPQVIRRMEAEDEAARKSNPLETIARGLAVPQPANAA